MSVVRSRGSAGGDGLNQAMNVLRTAKAQMNAPQEDACGALICCVKNAPDTLKTAAIM